jgi:hypothetical protein
MRATVTVSCAGHQAGCRSPAEVDEAGISRDIVTEPLEWEHRVSVALLIAGVPATASIDASGGP